MEREYGDSPRPELSTPVAWFGCINVRHALVVLNTMILTIAILGTTLMAIYMAQRLRLMQLEELLISASTLALWSCAVGITLFGICTIWSQKTAWVELYFWIQLVHWVLDLAAMIVLLVFAYSKRVVIAQSMCFSKPNHQLCLETFNARLIMMTCGLCLYKVTAAYAWYLLFHCRKALIADEKQNPPMIRFLRRTSTSSLSSIFEKKWWSPSQIPIIKIDFASDESSASVYSNDSPGYRTVNFGMQYPSLAAPQPAIFASHLGGDALVPGARQAYPDAPPGLPTFSIVGSERGALT